MAKTFSVTISLSYHERGLYNLHSFSYDVQFRNVNVTMLEDFIKHGEIKSLKDAVNAIASKVKDLKASFTLDVIMRTDQKEETTMIELKVVPSEVYVKTKDGRVERQKFELLKDGKEYVLTVLRKEVKKVKEAFKAAALEALAERARKAEAK